jgi:excisionase family DNA binding protein
MLNVASPKIHRSESAKSLPTDTQVRLSLDLESGSNGATLILLTESEVSQLLRVSLARLRKWRVEKRGPRFIKIGSLVRYRSADLQQWLASLPTGGDGSLARG